MVARSGNVDPTFTWSDRPAPVELDVRLIWCLYPVLVSSAYIQCLDPVLGSSAWIQCLYF